MPTTWTIFKILPAPTCGKIFWYGYMIQETNFLRTISEVELHDYLNFFCKYQKKKKKKKNREKNK